MLRRVLTRSIALAVFGMACSSTLAQAQSAKQPAPKKPAPKQPAPKRSPGLKSPQARLAKKVTVNLQNVTLEDAFSRLKELSKDPQVKDDPGLKLFVDPVALSEANLTLQSKVNLVLSDMPLGTVLRLLLGPLGLTYTVRGDLVVVTSRRR